MGEMADRSARKRAEKLRRALEALAQAEDWSLEDLARALAAALPEEFANPAPAAVLSLPGSAHKVAILAARATSGQALFAEGDVPGIPAGKEQDADYLPPTGRKNAKPSRKGCRPGGRRSGGCPLGPKARP
jgi:hypothetical protein